MVFGCLNSTVCLSLLHQHSCWGLIRATTQNAFSCIQSVRTAEVVSHYLISATLLTLKGPSDVPAASAFLSASSFLLCFCFTNSGFFSPLASCWMRACMVIQSHVHVSVAQCACVILQQSLHVCKLCTSPTQCSLDMLIWLSKSSIIVPQSMIVYTVRSNGSRLAKKLREITIVTR